MDAGGSLSAGFTGVAWTAELLCDDDGADGSDVDAALEALVAARPYGDHFDLMAGLAGIAVYALERLPRGSAQRILANVVGALDAASVPRAEGLAWRTDRALRPEPLRADTPEWDLGVAHGTPGVIAVLGRVCASEASPATRKRARKLLDRAVAWLLAQQLPEGSGGAFPIASGGRGPARAAWCYGDPGVAAALIVAARCTGEMEWARAAKRIAIAAAARDERACGVDDAGLCHGAAGLGHVYHRLYRATGDERLAEVARQWLMRAVAMGESGARFVWEARENRERVSHPGFLSGGGGIALALLAATGDADAAWDRALGISAREAAA
jgi:lantibiotic modifying enzyme